MFEAQVNTEVETTAVVNLDIFPDAPMPFAIHLFGADKIERWNNAQDNQRAESAQEVMYGVLVLARSMNLTDTQAASLYNRLLVTEGIEDHAVEYLGGGYDTVE